MPARATDVLSSMGDKRAFVAWLVALIAVALFFLLIKAFSVNPYAGDEFI